MAEDTRSVWEKLGLPNPDEEENEEETGEEYEDLEEEAEEEAAENDKISRKLSASVENLEKKFDNLTLEQRKKDFREAADPIELELFNAVAADVKDVATLDNTMKVVLKRAEEMRQKVAELEEQAREQVSKAWGVKPGKASHSEPDPDEIENLRARARLGDQKAAYKLFRDAPTNKELKD